MEHGKSGGKIVSFYHAMEKDLWKENPGPMKNSYLAFVTNTRKDGYCELIICHHHAAVAEQFTLYFDTRGLVKWQQLWGKAEIHAALQQKQFAQIHYQQALLLIGDSVRQNYKYGQNLDCIETIPFSEHLERIWQPEYYQYDADCFDYLNDMSLQELHTAYIQAIMQKDSAMFYELWTREQRRHGNRELELYHASHVLDDLEIVSFDLECSYLEENTQNLVQYFVLQAFREPDVLLEMDIALWLNQEGHGYRLCKERILESRLVACLAQQSMDVSQKSYFTFYSIRDYAKLEHWLDQQLQVQYVRQTGIGLHYRIHMDPLDGSGSDRIPVCKGEIVLKQTEMIVYGRDLNQMNQFGIYLMRHAKGLCLWQDVVRGNFLGLHDIWRKNGVALQAVLEPLRQRFLIKNEDQDTLRQLCLAMPKLCRRLDGAYLDAYLIEMPFGAVEIVFAGLFAILICFEVPLQLLHDSFSGTWNMLLQFIEEKGQDFPSVQFRLENVRVVKTLVAYEEILERLYFKRFV